MSKSEIWRRVGKIKLQRFIPIIGIIIVMSAVTATSLIEDDQKETCNVMSGECGSPFVEFSDGKPQDEIIDNMFISKEYGVEVSVPSPDDWLIINNPKVMSLSNELPEIGSMLDQVSDNIVQIRKKSVIDDSVIVDIFRQKNMENYSVEELATGLENMGTGYSSLMKLEGMEFTTYGFKTHLFPDDDMAIISYQQKVCMSSTDECAYSLIVTKYFVQEEYYYSVTGALTAKDVPYSDETSSDMFYIINSVKLSSMK